LAELVLAVVGLCSCLFSVLLAKLWGKRDGDRTPSGGFWILLLIMDQQRELWFFELVSYC